MTPEIFIKRLEKVVINGTITSAVVESVISADNVKFNFKDEINIDPAFNFKKNIENYLTKKILEINGYTEANQPKTRNVIKIPVDHKALNLDLDKIAATKKDK